MFTGTLQAVSNREDWQFTIDLTDPDTLAPVDLTDLTFTFGVRPEGSMTCSVTSDNATMTLSADALSTAVFVPVATMKTLNPGSYDFGMTVTIDGLVYQLVSGSLPIVDGVVP